MSTVSDLTQTGQPPSVSDVTQTEMPPSVSDVTQTGQPPAVSDVTKTEQPPSVSDVTQTGQPRVSAVTNTRQRPVSDVTQTGQPQGCVCTPVDISRVFQNWVDKSFCVFQKALRLYMLMLVCSVLIRRL